MLPGRVRRMLSARANDGNRLWRLLAGSQTVSVISVDHNCSYRILSQRAMLLPKSCGCSYLAKGAGPHRCKLFACQRRDLASSYTGGTAHVPDTSILLRVFKLNAAEACTCD